MHILDLCLHPAWTAVTGANMTGASGPNQRCPMKVDGAVGCGCYRSGVPFFEIHRGGRCLIKMNALWREKLTMVPSVGQVDNTPGAFKVMAACLTPSVERPSGAGIACAGLHRSKLNDHSALHMIHSLR
jgi:hypothetical protein